jgi:hypothetical protein
VPCTTAATGRTTASARNAPEAVVIDDAAGAAGDEAGTRYALPRAPSVERDVERQAPRFELTIRLTRLPTAADPALAPLIEGGRFAVTLTLALPPQSQSSLLRALFAERVEVRLRTQGGQQLAAAAGAGAGASVSLEAELDAEAAKGVLAALEGGAAGLEVDTEVEYRTKESNVVELTGQWSIVYDQIQQNLRGDSIEAERLRAGLAAMVRSGHIKARLDGRELGSLQPPVLDAVYRAFERAGAFVLEAAGPGRFKLRRRPPEGMPLSVRMATGGAATRTRRSSAPLEAIVGGVLDGLPRDAYVHLVASGDRGTFVSVPRLAHSVRGYDTNGGAQRRRGFVSLDGEISSLSLVLRPERTRRWGNALLATHAVASLGRLGLWEGGDVVVPAPDSEPESLPIVEDATAAIWPDRVEARWWYVPAFVAVIPDPAEDPDEAAFGFTFKQSGVTAEGRPGLDGTVRFKLEPRVPDAAAAALAEHGGPLAAAVPPVELAVALEVPFRVRETGETRTQLFPGSVERAEDGTLSVAVNLLDDWVRLCYGALSSAGFQAQPVRASVTYAFRVYRPHHADVPLLVGGKIPSLLIASTAAEIGRLGRPVYIADRRVLKTRDITVRYELEAPRTAAARSKRKPIGSLLSAHAVPFVTAHAEHPIAAETPVSTAVSALMVSPEVLAQLHRTEYVLETIGRNESVDLLFACSTLGSLYRQETQEGLVAVGCRDALRLGEAQPRQYEEVEALRKPTHRVFRSLQQPGRFLVLPAMYRITRYGPLEPPERAYRPVALIYATLDETGSRYFFAATLQPDLPPFVRAEIVEHVKKLAPQRHEVTLDFPTDPAVAKGVSYRWAVPDGVAQPQVLATWDGFSVTVSTDLTDALTLRTVIQTSGLSGVATFEFGDGSKLETSLMLDTQIVGPWSTGPLELTSRGAGIRVVNRIERIVNLHELLLVPKAGPSRRVPAGVTLEPDANRDIPLEADGTDDVLPVFTVAPGKPSLDEVRVFVEDVTATAIFVNLVNFANHQLNSMQLEVRLAGTAEVKRADLAEGATARVDFTLPLTTYLQQQNIEFRAVKTHEDGTVVSSWLAWDLSKGNVIDLTWERIEANADKPAPARRVPAGSRR